MKTATRALILNRPARLAAVCAISLFGLAACKDKPKPGTPGGAAEEAAEPVKPAAVVELDPSGYNAKRTQAFGFLSRMPATTEGAIGLRNFSDVVDGFLGSEMFKRAAAMMEQAGGYDPDSVQMVKSVIEQYVGKEMFFVLSEGAAEQYARLQLISKMMGEMNFKTLGADLAGGGGADQLTALQQYISSALKDENSEMSKALESFEIPPFIAGTKMTAAGAQEIVDRLDQLEKELPPVFTVSGFEAGGGKFTSWKVNLQDVFTVDAEAGLNEFLQDDAATTRVAAMIRKKKVEFSFGVMDNYLVFALGTDHRHLDFVTKPEESILATKSFGFADQFLDKQLVSYAYVNRALLGAALQDNQMGQMADAFAAGLASGGPAMRKLGTYLKSLAGQLDGFGKRESQTYLGINYLDEGLHGDSTGGFSSDLVDAKTKNLFANAAPVDAAMVVSSVATPARNAKSIAMMETLAAGVEVGIAAYAESSGDESVLEQFGQMKAMFGDDLAAIWGILKGKVADGLGSHSGIVVDLNGGMPSGLPIPKVLVEQGKVPRIALAADVKDRAKLAAAWDELVPAIDEVLKKIPGQEPGKEVQVPGVVSLDSDDLVTHHFSLPFITPDFIPSISLNDQLLFLSTSKNFSESIAAGAKAGKGDIRGTYMMMNFKELHAWAEGWLELVQTNSAALFEDEFAAESFKETAAGIRMALDFTRGIHGFKYNRYVDDAGAWRSSWHLRFEDLKPAGE